jgi:ABC-2 type transport system permease protein
VIAAARPYAAIVSMRFRLLLQYRIAAIAGVWTQLVFGLILIMIYDAFYRSIAAPPPMPLAQTASYVWLGQALYSMLPWNIDAEMHDLIRSGGVAYELCRPIDVYAMWYARAVAMRTAPTLLRALPMVVISAIVLPLVGLGEWRLAAPPSLAAGAGFAVALACALVLGCAIGTLLNILMMWTIAAEGIRILSTTVILLGSGMLVPLPLLPGWLQAVLRWLPFAGLVDLPFRVYTGHIAIDELALVLARQLGWAAVIIAIGRWTIRHWLRRLVVEGG